MARMTDERLAEYERVVEAGCVSAPGFSNRELLAALKTARAMCEWLAKHGFRVTENFLGDFPEGWQTFTEKAAADRLLAAEDAVTGG